MIIQPILLKVVKDLGGTIQGIELCQGDQTVLVTVGSNDPAVHKTGYAWPELKKAIDSLAEHEYRMLGYDLPSEPTKEDHLREIILDTLKDKK